MAHIIYKTADNVEVASVTQVLGCWHPDLNGLLAWANSIPKEEWSTRRYEAANAGSQCHDWIQCALTGQELGSDRHLNDDQRRWARNAYAGFARWWEQNGNDVASVECEVPFVHSEHLFGGTVDLIATMTDGRILVLDWKTAKQIRFSMGVQCSAYRSLIEHNRPGVEIDSAGVVRLEKETQGYEERFYTRGEMDEMFRFFLLLLEARTIEQRCSSY